jgi:uncharacterized membrane protein
MWALSSLVLVSVAACLVVVQVSIATVWTAIAACTTNLVCVWRDRPRTAWIGSTVSAAIRVWALMVGMFGVVCEPTVCAQPGMGVVCNATVA